MLNRHLIKEILIHMLEICKEIYLLQKIFARELNSNPLAFRASVLFKSHISQKINLKREFVFLLKVVSEELHFH